MTRKDQETIEALIAGGIIGAALGALLSKNTSGSALGAIAGAAILASAAAHKRAIETQIPFVIEENDALYELHPDGTKRFIRSLPKPNKTVRRKFRLD